MSGLWQLRYQPPLFCRAQPFLTMGLSQLLWDIVVRQRSTAKPMVLKPMKSSRFRKASDTHHVVRLARRALSRPNGQPNLGFPRIFASTPAPQPPRWRYNKERQAVRLPRLRAYSKHKDGSTRRKPTRGLLWSTHRVSPPTRVSE